MDDLSICHGCLKPWQSCRCGVNLSRWTDEEKELAYGPGWRAKLDRASTEGYPRMTNTEASRAAEQVSNVPPVVKQGPMIAVDLETGKQVRTFETGATRHTDTGKYDYEGFLSPAVLQEFAKYMHHHRVQANGELRDSDNWQKGMPLDAYMKSMLRHVMDLWLIHRGHNVTRPEDGSDVTLEDALGGILFNCQGYWHESLKETDGTTD